LNIPKGEGRYAGLLTPQGKLLFDFFVVPLPEGPDAGYLIDCASEQTTDLVKRLNLHKMRAKIAIEDKSEYFAVAAIFGGDMAAGIDGVGFRDTRGSSMGFRVIAPRDALAKLHRADASRYEAHRIAQGVPKGGVDFVHGNAFVHDVNLDLMNGVDFKKGCYVGQEVVARVHYRNSARKRTVKIHFDGPAPAQGTQITAGETNIGEVGSTAGSFGLAMLRLDRLAEARAAGVALKAGEMAVDVIVPG
ncbi:MAG: folate-binding protein, partial [Pseudomonadota bacterium]|nr:folate-binding protein [Pseudomonadota bacterium]